MGRGSLAGLLAYAALPSSVKAMPGDEDQLDVVVETEAEPIDAMHPFPDRPDVMRLPESEPMTQPIVDR